MPRIIKPEQVKVITTTKEGICDVHITLDINVSIDSDGLKVNLKANSTEQKAIEDDVIWAIPDFKTKEKIKFGKEEGK